MEVTTGLAAGSFVPVLIALLIVVVAVVLFSDGVREKLGTGMTGFDSTWYHGPFAAGFFQSGDTWDLHFVAPQFLAWFYPANAEVFHATGMLAFDRDILSPLLNLGWFVGCLVAVWCIGRPFGVAPGRPYGAAPWSLALGAVALSVPALADQAGEARNDIVGVFFLLAAVAIALNAPNGQRPGPRERSLPQYPPQTAFALGAPVVSGLAAGLAAGAKLNFLLPAAVLVVGLALVAPRGARLRALLATGLAALAGGGYWYLRNLVHTGNPLPWVDGIGPLSLPSPDQALGGRERHSVLGYLDDGPVWSDWLLPGLHDGLTLAWPLLLAAALAGLVLCLASPWLARRRSTRFSDASPATKSSVREPSSAGESGAPRSSHSGRPAQTGPARGAIPAGADSQRLLAVAGLTGLAALLAWLVAPTSASGPEGTPLGFESGLRYLAPALVLGLSLLPVTVTALRRTRGRPLTAPLARVEPEQGGLTEPGGPRTPGSDAGGESVPVAERRGGPARPHRVGDGTHGPTALSTHAGEAGGGHPPNGRILKVPSQLARHLSGRGMSPARLAAAAFVVAVAIGYPVQRHYLESRYADPAFAAPGLDATFAWARDVSGARIATTATRQHPLFGTALSNRVEFVGVERPHGGFVAPTTCRRWRRLLNDGDYDYVVASRDRLEPGTPPYPATARWTVGPGATVVLRTPPTVVFQLTAPLDPSACP